MRNYISCLHKKETHAWPMYMEDLIYLVKDLHFIYTRFCLSVNVRISTNNSMFLKTPYALAASITCVHNVLHIVTAVSERVP